MELLIMQFSPASRHFIPLSSKYCPKHLVSRIYKTELEAVIILSETNRKFSLRHHFVQNMPETIPSFLSDGYHDLFP
jgi:hypothetical protein